MFLIGYQNSLKTFGVIGNEDHHGHSHELGGHGHSHGGGHGHSHGGGASHGHSHGNPDSKIMKGVCFWLSVNPGNPCKSGRPSTVDPLAVASLDQLLLKIQRFDTCKRQVTWWHNFNWNFSIFSNGRAHIRHCHIFLINSGVEKNEQHLKMD